MRHRYLYTLEVAPVEAGRVYNELPSHLTLMARFFSGLSPAELGGIARPLFERTPPAALVFGQTTELGPKKLTVHLLEHPAALQRLHTTLHGLLERAGAEFEYPQFTGEHYKPHVTQREGLHFAPGDTFTATHACLIEVVEGQRAVRETYPLSENAGPRPRP